MQYQSILTICTNEHLSKYVEGSIGTVSDEADRVRGAYPSRIREDIKNEQRSHQIEPSRRFSMTHILGMLRLTHAVMSS